MELDQKTGKLITLLFLVNLISAAVGVASTIFFGVLTGLTVFILLIVTLPLGIQYLYLKKKTGGKTS